MTLRSGHYPRDFSRCSRSAAVFLESAEWMPSLSKRSRFRLSTGAAKLSPGILSPRGSRVSLGPCRAVRRDAVPPLWLRGAPVLSSRSADRCGFCTVPLRVGHNTLALTLLSWVVFLSYTQARSLCCRGAARPMNVPLSDMLIQTSRLASLGMSSSLLEFNLTVTGSTPAVELSPGFPSGALGNTC